MAGEPSRQASDSLTITGPLIVEHQLDVLAQREGVVAKLVSETGKRVRTGELLAQLDDRQLAADLEAARAKTRSTDADQKNWKAEARVLDADASRAQKMWDAQLITREQWEHAKFKAEADQWDVQRVEQMLINSREAEHSLKLELEKTRSGLLSRESLPAGMSGRPAGCPGRPFVLGYRGSAVAHALYPSREVCWADQAWPTTRPHAPRFPRRRAPSKGCGSKPGGRSHQRHFRWNGGGSRSVGPFAPRHERGCAPRLPSMNLTQALNVALPEIPARVIAQRCPRLHPEVIHQEHIVDGRPTVRIYVPGVDAVFNLSPQTWDLVRFFDGQRGYDEVAEAYFQETGIRCFGRRTARNCGRSGINRVLVQDAAREEYCLPDAVGG